MRLRWQIKGVNNYHGGRTETMTRENITVEKGWVASSSNRREYLFVQFDEDMDEAGRLLYTRLNNLREPPLPRARPFLLSDSRLACV